jgi:alanyl-tRNA synthetase
MYLEKRFGNQIRQDFIDFFVQRGHTFVPSSSLVPGGDQTLLFTNAGMVQFKDVFLGTDKRPYNRAADSQKCMRVAGKHNDLEDVGRDDTHHTFFEMLGNWSFGDYYKEEAIDWAWDLLTKVWTLPKNNLWATCFQDDIGDIPRDDEAANAWRKQPGMLSNHILYFGRKDNFWEMAETGPCGPCSEIHLDRGAEYCNQQRVPGHVCGVNTDCKRFLELWNLVFIQYNRLNPTLLEPLPARHVDTGMGLERIVSVLQDVNSNYLTDLLYPMIEKVQQLTGHGDDQFTANPTPYRVIADHSRAAAFLIADGVVPGNTGRNYICRMIIRRAARFGSKIGLTEPFLAKTAETVIENYGSFYPELVRNESTILDSITREEERFHRTLESGTTKLENLLDRIKQQGGGMLSGEQAFDLYATFGLPFEISRDIARERNLEIDEPGYQAAMEEHRLASGAGETFGSLGGEDVNVYRLILEELQKDGLLGPNGVIYDPYTSLETSGKVLSLVKGGQSVAHVMLGDTVEVVLPKTCFYTESGGQVSDTGSIRSAGKTPWEIRVDDTRKPAAGVIVHLGTVLLGKPCAGDPAIAKVDTQRRQDIMRNHTATHLLHHQLNKVLGAHARQAGSLVAPDRLRFDFTHPEALTNEQLERVEAGVNQEIWGNYRLNIECKPREQAIDEGAMALFGEKYTDTVRNIKIGDPDVFSNELCGGTHVPETGDIGLFLITSEGSAAAGIRRIEAVTGRIAYELAHQRLQTLKQASEMLLTTPDQMVEKAKSLIHDLSATRKQLSGMRQKLASAEFEQTLQSTQDVAGIHLAIAQFTDTDTDTLRQMVDRFREKYNRKGIVVLASVSNARPTVIVALTNDLAEKGMHAGELAKHVATFLDGSGGGKTTLAQAGGKDASRLEQALDSVAQWIAERQK